MLGLITSDRVIAGLILGIPLSVIALVLIWIKPRKPVAAWALVSVLIGAAVTAGIWGALRSGTGQAATSPAPPAPPFTSPHRASPTARTVWRRRRTRR